MTEHIPVLSKLRSKSGESPKTKKPKVRQGDSEREMAP